MNKITEALRNKFNTDPCVTTARGYIHALEVDIDIAVGVAILSDGAFLEWYENAPDEKRKPFEARYIVIKKK